MSFLYHMYSPFFLLLFIYFELTFNGNFPVRLLADRLPTFDVVDAGARMARSD